MLPLISAFLFRKVDGKFDQVSGGFVARQMRMPRHVRSHIEILGNTLSEQSCPPNVKVFPTKVCE